MKHQPSQYQMCVSDMVHVHEFSFKICMSLFDFSCPANVCYSQAMGYGMVLLDGNVVNINKLKKLNVSRIDRIFKVRLRCCQRVCWVTGVGHGV